jgi:hypothetical protein
MRKTMARTIRSKGGTVIFTVTVPENTTGLQQSVFLVGSLRQFSPNLPDWDPHGLAMRRVDERNWTLTLMGQENAVVEYKYTLGDWAHIEKDITCADIPNRRVVVRPNASGAQTIHDTVERWPGIESCNES